MYERNDVNAISILKQCIGKVIKTLKNVLIKT